MVAKRSDVHRKPDFFLVGAPKSGTTALSRYLSDHDRVFVTNPKEPLFFCDDFSGLPSPRTIAEYEALFESAPASALAIGEASAMYLYSRVAPQRIWDYAPNARLIVALRNPLELAVSFHAQQLYGMSEDVADFEAAWRLQEARARGSNLPRLVREPRFLQYRDVAKLGEQVDRLLGVVPRNRVHFVVFDDLVSAPRMVYLELLRFLDLPDDGRVDFPVVNERKSNRSAWLARILHRPPPILSRAAARLKKSLGRADFGFLDGLRRRNAEPSKKTVVSPGLRAEMIESFRADLELLSGLVERDLTHWLDE